MAEAIKDIKNRIKSIQSTRQITKAMELVASSKLRGARERVDMSRPFFDAYRETIDNIMQNSRVTDSVYCSDKTPENPCYCIIGGDRGLAGGYNMNVFKAALAHMENKNCKILPIGRKTVDYFRGKYEFITEDYGVVSNIKISDCLNMGNRLSKGFADGDFDGVYIAYTQLTNMMVQTPVVIQVLPLKAQREKGDKPRTEVLYEPSPNAVFENIMPGYIGGLLCNNVAESYASELCARRNAMETATQNADEMVESLNLRYNRARQTAITQEITEIVSGS